MTFIALVLDIVILLCLAVTIYYAIRLTRHLKSFRVYRQEFGGLIAELSRNIDDAQSAVAHLKATGNDTADRLQGLLKESSFMSDELQLMNETGNNLAKRLENLAEKNSVSGAGGRYGRSDVEPESDVNSSVDAERSKAVSSRTKPELSASGKRRKKSVDMPSFFIQDRDFDEDENDDEIEGASDSRDGGDLGGRGGFAVEDNVFSSQAERDLYEALEANKNS